MSESENLPPPTSSPKTSSVPLKKETVRITLRARSGEGAPVPPVSAITGGVPTVAPKRATAPIQLPSAPLPPPAPKASTSPIKLAPAPSLPMPPPARPPAPPAATVPMAPPTAPLGGPPRPPAPPAAPSAIRPSAPTAPGAPPKIETGAATVPLAKTMPVRPSPTAPRPGTGTGPLVSTPGGGAPGGGLPKATVKLQQTQPMARPSVSAPPSAPVKRTANADAEQFYNDEKDPEQGLVPLSVVCFLLSVGLLVVQMFGSDKISTNEDSPIMVPAAVPVKWEVRNEDRTWTNNFSRSLPVVPQ